MEMLPSAETVLCWAFKKEWYSQALCLKTIYTPSAGHDWVEEDPNNKVIISYGHFHGKIIAQTLLAMLLLFNRRLSFNIENQKKAIWNRDFPVSPILLEGQKILIIGFGSIGRHIADILHPFGCIITGVKRNPDLTNPHPSLKRLIPMSDLMSALPEADHVISILPGSPENKKIISMPHFSRMNPSAFFYNVGRGTCIDESALMKALTENIIAGAYLDVFETEPLPADSPLWKTKKLIMTPHVSASDERYMDMFLDEIGEPRTY